MSPSRNTPPRSDCAIAGTLDVVGDRWSLLIVRDLLFHGELRFADLVASAEGMPTNTLSDRLRRLEESGVLVREPYSDRPVRHRYRLTERGRGSPRSSTPWPPGGHSPARHAQAGER
nr:hypothetical protein GCM10020093_013080 [Planobispora longispora]